MSKFPVGCSVVAVRGLFSLEITIGEVFTVVKYQPTRTLWVGTSDEGTLLNSSGTITLDPGGVFPSVLFKAVNVVRRK